MTWQGVILEESLEDTSLLNLTKIIKTGKEQMEGEDRVLTFHNVEVLDENKEEFVRKAIKSIKQSFYLHLCKEGVMYVIFKDKMFKFSKGYPELETAREYGKSICIFEKLLEDPFA